MNFDHSLPLTPLRSAPPNSPISSQLSFCSQLNPICAIHILGSVSRGKSMYYVNGHWDITDTQLEGMCLTSGTRLFI